MKQLDERYPRLHEERAPTSPTGTIGTPVGQLDVETVVKASQALSSEIVLPRLIETLMRLVVEHAGAERGVLIFLQGDEPLIEAEATTAHGRVEVNVRQAVITPSDLLGSAVHYVIRTRARVVLDDASTSSSYSEDEYVRQNRPRSVLCVPIVKQTTLLAALYLENNLTPGVFTSVRVAVLELLASQAAISLENALLYQELRKEVVERTRGEERIRQDERELRVGGMPTRQLKDRTMASTQRVTHHTARLNEKLSPNIGGASKVSPDLGWARPISSRERLASEP